MQKILKNDDDGDEDKDDDGREKNKYKQRPCAKNGNKNVGI